ncbi:hypothetical protein JTB14_010620 [Gonioctena quinquepunctata]|nr:hypothetical protein JTB14_010620 [Gonioctena quinquepunctata]
MEYSQAKTLSNSGAPIESGQQLTDSSWGDFDLQRVEAEPSHRSRADEKFDAGLTQENFSGDRDQLIKQLPRGDVRNTQIQQLIRRIRESTQ